MWHLLIVACLSVSFAKGASYEQYVEAVYKAKSFAAKRDQLQGLQKHIESYLKKTPQTEANRTQILGLFEWKVYLRTIKPQSFKKEKCEAMQLKVRLISGEPPRSQVYEEIQKLLKDMCS